MFFDDFPSGHQNINGWSEKFYLPVFGNSSVTNIAEEVSYLMSLQAAAPAVQVTTYFQAMSGTTENTPTDKSVTIETVVRPPLTSEIFSRNEEKIATARPVSIYLY